MAKILLIASKDYNYYNFRSEMILKLVELGHEVVLSCPPGDKIKFFTDRGCSFVPHDMDRRGTSISADLKLIYAYYKLFKTVKPDILLTYTGKSSAYGGMVSRFMRIPRIINNAGLMDSRYYDKMVKFVLDSLFWLGFKNADCMMYQNSQERDYIRRIIGMKTHYRDIPGSGVNLEKFQYVEYPDESKPITFNYVGRLVSIKGINEFLTCAERIKKKYSNTRFVIYGDYDEDIYKARVLELEKKGIVVYGGVQMNMKPYIEQAHAVIHPSYYEGMTNVVLEHSAMGRVCIGSDIPGVRDGIEEGITGFVFPRQDVDALVQKVERFINLPYEEKVAMGKAARVKMEREFDRNIVTNIYIEEINRILAKNK